MPNSEYVIYPYLICTVVFILWLSSETLTKKKAKTKTQRKWGIEAPTETDMASLDYSVDKPDDDASRGSHDLYALVDKASLGVRTQDGMYEVKDWEFSRSGDDETDNVIAKALNKSNLGNKVASTSGSSLGAIGSLFARLTGAKVLTEEDLKPVLEGMKQHLMKKNVAKEIADKVCEGVGETLVGKKVGSFQSTSHLFQRLSCKRTDNRQPQMLLSGWHCPVRSRVSLHLKHPRTCSCPSARSYHLLYLRRNSACRIVSPSWA